MDAPIKPLRIAVISDEPFLEWQELIEVLDIVKFDVPYTLVAIPSSDIGKGIGSYAALNNHPLTAYKKQYGKSYIYQELLNSCDGVIGFIRKHESKLHDLIYKEIRQGKYCKLRYFNYRGMTK